MIKKVTLTLTIFSAFLISKVEAQNVYFTGLGRALVTNDNLSDKTKEDSKLKSSGGYTLFDLGIYAKPNEVLRGGVILRTRNEFGGFFGDGSSLTFRQMQLEGLIAKKVKYEIGDIYLTHTPYTLWNEEAFFTKYESNIFSGRRDIVNYENFFVGNAWRMQGINANSKINFTKGIQSIGIRGYCGRTMQTDFATIPERYFYGGRLDLTQSKYFRIAGNVAGLSDIAGTVKAASVDYDNMVYTTDFAFTLDKSEKFKFVLSGEAGASHFELKRAIDTSDRKYDDYFYDGGIKATYKPWNVNVGASYRNVGFNFNSPMAQTRRLNSTMDGTYSTLPTLNDGTTGRSTTLFDSYSQERGLYNQAISATLMNYFVGYTMAEPYGKATPNRKGFSFVADAEPASKLFKASVEANLLSEIVSEGDSLTMAKRKFTLIRGGFTFNINKLLKFEKLIAISAGMRTESSTRGATNPVNLASSMMDLGLDIEVLKDLHVLGGLKTFYLKGNEIQTGRDQMNQITTFGPGLNYNFQENTIAGGLRYDYGTGGYFSMNYNMVTRNDKLASTTNFNLNQLFFVFGMKF